MIAMGVAFHLAETKNALAGDPHSAFAWWELRAR
tara:strand:- start:1417 stop:1518 length:102 start_codon:yes stop_codon:yes gene_type:complete